MFHRCPAKRHTHYDAPSNGTFVASNVRTQECTPSRKAEILALHMVAEISEVRCFAQSLVYRRSI